MTLDFWFEFASTYSYPAAMRIEAAATRQGVTVRWRPFLLGPIFKESGWNDSPFNLQVAKGRYMWRDLERVCASLEIPLRRPSVFPRNGLLAGRVACACSHETWLPAFVRGIYRANFAEDQDISSRDVVTRCLEAVNQDPLRILGLADEPAAKQALREQTEIAARLGVFGAPSFVVGDELFWGNDRLEAALAWSATARKGTSGEPVQVGVQPDTPARQSD